MRARLLLAALGSASAAALGVTQLAAGDSPRAAPAPTTPIEHLVVVFDENVSFDHYFATYPDAANLAGETPFTKSPSTPAGIATLKADNLLAPLNPNSVQPARLTPSQAVTCDQDHGYHDEQLAFHGGAMDLFPEHTNGGGCPAGFVMDYYDGNTVTGLWNLAQRFTMSDATYATTFGPSTPGALNLIAGQTHGATTAAGARNGTIIEDPDPTGDDCGNGGNAMTGKNIGDLMSAAGMTWGWFQGGFRPTSVDGTGKATCGAAHANAAGASVRDYSAHHEPFQYYASTANPHHLPPSSAAMIGHDDQANHQYDLKDFDVAVRDGHLPQVSFLKAPSSEDGHAGYSGPRDEQRWLARVVDLVQSSPDWASTAIVITYDDSDGWYDHKVLTPQQGSDDADASRGDALNGPGVCGAAPAPGAYRDRCGPGPRLPLLVVSPWVAPNTVHHTQREQTSVLRFIEDNWLAGQRLGDQSFDERAATLTSMFDFDPAHVRAAKAYLDPATGQVLDAPPAGLATSPDGPPPADAPPSTPPPATTPPATTTPLVTAPAPPLRPTLRATGRRRGRTLRLTLTVGRIGTAPTTVAVQLRRGTRTLGRARGTVRGGRVGLRITARRRLTVGRYLLHVVVTQGTRTATRTLVLRVR